MKDFKRENRYTVLKHDDVRNALSTTEIQTLAYLEERINGYRQSRGKQPIETVVVESDWHQYEPTWRLIEDGHKAVVLPSELTAENGAKALLMGEFYEQVEQPCPNPFCNNECHICDGSGTHTIHRIVEWRTIKAIYAKIVANMAVKA